MPTIACKILKDGRSYGTAYTFNRADESQPVSADNPPVAEVAEADAHYFTDPAFYYLGNREVIERDQKQAQAIVDKANDSKPAAKPQPKPGKGK